MSATELRQACDAADSMLAYAVRDIDDRFGKGFAEKTPGIVAAYMQSASADFLFHVIHQEVQTLADAISSIAGAVDGHGG